MHLILYLLDQLRLYLVNDLYLLIFRQIINIMHFQVLHLVLHHNFQFFLHLLLNILLQDLLYLLLITAILGMIIRNHVDELFVRSSTDVTLIVGIVWNRHELGMLTRVDWRNVVGMFGFLSIVFNIYLFER